MNLTQIIVCKHRDQQSFVCYFNIKAQCVQTCVVVSSPDSLIVKYFMTFCMFELFLSESSEATQTCLQEEVSFQVRSLQLKST